MSYDDFDVDRLADYLRVRPDQVARLAERGKLPGRRIAGQWRFSQAEIHTWWEDRIGTLDDEELADVEAVLQYSRTRQFPQFSLAEMMPETAIALPLVARTRNSVITSMVQLAAGTGLLWDEQRMEDAVRARENLHPTALDNGVALMHPRRPMSSILAEPFLALGRTDHGIPFGGGRTLTDIFFLVCSTDDRGHLRCLARLSRIIGQPAFLSDLRAATDLREVRPLFEAYEAQLQE
ncbi:MAG: PTS sugar transporter subunit IIA [Pirellulaceae bacterium]